MHGRESDARQPARRKIRREASAVDPRRAENLEGRGRPAADGDVRRLEQADAGIESGRVERAHVGRGVHPLEPRLVVPQAAVPAPHPDDGQIRSDPAPGVEEPGQLAERHARPNRNRVVGREGELVPVGDRALERQTADGIGPVEHHDGDLRPGRFLEDIAQRRHVGVEARADILDVEDESVEAGEILRARAPRLAVERSNGQTRSRVQAVGDGRVRVRSRVRARGKRAPRGRLRPSLPPATEAPRPSSGRRASGR